MCEVKPTGEGSFYHTQPQKVDESSPLRDRITHAYQVALQDFSQSLFRKGWIVPSLVIPTIFGEFGETVRTCARRISGWKSTWEKYGFFNGSDPASLDQLRQRLQEGDSSIYQNPVLLFHGIYSSPDIWLPWADELYQAKQQRKIGHVITLQLPNDMEERMKVVYRAIEDVVRVYREVNPVLDVQVDLIGHSLGGYAAHLAKYQEDKIVIRDEANVERRWHSHDPAHSNHHVRKVITVGAATWLCCHGQHDETTICDPAKEDIYPWKVFSDKTIEKSFTTEQLKVIRSIHHNIYDFVGVYDGISSVISPLPERQVFTFKHGHLGLDILP